MGRPLTDRWIGKPSADHPVLWPLVRISGEIQRAWILRQVGADKFLVESESGTVGMCRLTNTDAMPMDGLMCLRFSGTASGFVSRISNSKLKDFHGNQFAWSMSPDPDVPVHITDCNINKS